MVRLFSNLPVIDWHKWFAWYPIHCEGYLVWLKYVERKIIMWTYDDETEYRRAR